MGNVEANRMLEERTLEFSVAVIRFSITLPKTESGRVLERQLVRSGTSIGANYREANRAESRDDFIHKTALVLKEAAETDYWIEICTRMGFGEPTMLAPLSQETRELLAIFTTINRNAKARR